MLQDKYATSAHDQGNRGLTAELNHAQHNNNPVSNGPGIWMKLEQIRPICSPVIIKSLAL